MRRLQPSLAVAVSLVANILLLALLSTPTGATHYAVHMSVPQSGPSENAVQLAQWIFSARAAADDVNTNWASSTGNTLEILLLDNAGNSNLNVEHALDSIQNTSNVVALLLAEDEDNSNFADEIARLGRYFKVRIIRDSFYYHRVEDISSFDFRSLWLRRQLGPLSAEVPRQAERQHNLSVPDNVLVN